MTARHDPRHGAPAPVVRTGHGRVRGRHESGVAVFRGIPYARPPFGALRFRGPVPPEPWDGVRDALRFGPPPPQHDRLNPAAARAARPSPAPDCLTVNVWTPDPGAARLPVLVWFHGGAYTFGSAADPVYDGAVQARESAAVVVTFNYRVGVEGFARIDGAPDNRALLDQVAALRWVRENAAAFGGDPDRVTVFGESAGAGSLAALLDVAPARGLFGRAIAQSVPGAFLSPELASDVAADICAAVGRTPTLDDLAEVDPHLLVQAAEDVFATMADRAGRWGVLAHSETLFAPVVGSGHLTRTPWDAVAAGAAREVPLLIGCNRNEYRMFMAKRREFGAVTADRAEWALRVFGPGAQEGPAAYRARFPDAGPEELYERVTSDWLCRIPSLRLAEAQAAAGGPVHAYQLDWPAPGPGRPLGACHGIDVPLLFGTAHTPLARHLLGDAPSGEVSALSRRMRAAWAAFAATGDPGWPCHLLPERRTRIFDTTDRTGCDPLAGSRRAWSDHPYEVLGLTARRRA